MGTIARQQH